MLDPINRWCAYFADVNEAVKKRQHKLTDYDVHLIGSLPREQGGHLY